jgi:hypothetical protein
MFSGMFIENSLKIAKNVPFSKEAMDVFFQALDVMWKSMAGIFAVVLIFYIVILLLAKIGKTNEQ